jgi:hypothetical protein
MVRAHEQSSHFPALPHLHAHPSARDSDYSPNYALRDGTGGSAADGAGGSDVAPAYHNNSVQHSSELDAQYWKNMFLELGFQDSGEQSPV